MKIRGIACNDGLRLDELKAFFSSYVSKKSLGRLLFF